MKDKFCNMPGGNDPDKKDDTGGDDNKIPPR
jgi:hypothetical protein